MSHFISVSLFSITLILFSGVTKVKLRPSKAHSHIHTYKRAHTHTHSPQGKWWQTKLKLIQIILGKLLSFISIVLSWKRLFNAKCSRSLKPNFGGYVLSMNTSKKVTFNLSVQSHFFRRCYFASRIYLKVILFWTMDQERNFDNVSF